MDILDKINDIPKGLSVSKRLNLKNINIAKLFINDNIQYVYLDNNDYKNMQITYDDTRFEPIIPYRNIQRSIWYITGKSGCGKSRIAYVLTIQYNKIYPDNRVFYVCSTDIKDDENFGDLDFVKALDPEKMYSLDMEMDEEKELIKKLSNSLFIFDDIDMLPKEKKKIYTRLQSKLVEVGRKYGITLCIISHITLGGHNTRMILNEVDLYFCFKDNIENNGYLLKYLKYSPEYLKNIKTTSWVCFNNKYDCIITPKNINFK